MAIYKHEILLHSRQPQQYGTLTDTNKLSGDSANYSCGDSLHVEVVLSQSNVISKLKWSGEGCIISRASASRLSSYFLGKKLEEAQHLTSEQLLDILSWPISPSRISCATLLIQALKKISYDTNISN